MHDEIFLLVDLFNMKILIFRHEPLLLEQLLSLTDDSNENNLMKYYLQTRKFDDIIDYQLILLVIKYICQRRDGMLND